MTVVDLDATGHATQPHPQPQRSRSETRCRTSLPFPEDINSFRKDSVKSLRCSSGDLAPLPVYSITVPPLPACRSQSDGILQGCRRFPTYQSTGCGREDNKHTRPRCQWTNDSPKALHIIPVSTVNGGSSDGGGGESKCPPVVIQTTASLSGSRDHLEKDEDDAFASEKWYTTCVQVFFPFLLAGMGSVAASLLLDYVKDWPVYGAYRELFVLIPPLLGLNGNLEMTLVARLSTQANLGNLDKLREQLKQVGSNMALLQCQSTLVSLTACCLALLKGLFTDYSSITFLYASMLFACGVIAANIASLVLSTVMTTVVIVSRKLGINPDNVAAPIAASLGDLTTLALLSTVSSKLYLWKDSPYMTPSVFGLCILLLPFWFFVAHRNTMTRTVLTVGWIPILTAVVISSFGGYILDYSVIKFPGIALHLSAVNAVGGNLAAIFCCRLSTFLNRYGDRGVMPPQDQTKCAGPLTIFFGHPENARVARILLFIVIPGQIIFVVVTDVLRYGSITISPLFGSLYVIVALIQVAVLLMMSRTLVYWLWWWKIDPDNAAIPFITAAGDFTGTGLLTVAFFILAAVSDPVASSSL
ncbi:solute carrier family 41 member 3-like [Ornithodoros turicata]